MTESIQITELSMKDYEFVNRAYMCFIKNM